MSWFSDQFNQSAWNSGAGTPWGAPGSKGALWDALSSGKGTPWGAEGEKGMTAFQEPYLQSMTGELERSPSGAGDYYRGTASGINDMFGLGAPVNEPSYEKLPDNPANYSAPDFSDYKRAGNDAINVQTARNRNTLAAGLQKGGSLRSGDYGAGLGEIDYGASSQRGGLANAIAQMQRENQYSQLNADRDATRERNRNSRSNYQDRLDTRNSNRNSAMDLWKNSSAAYLAL